MKKILAVFFTCLYLLTSNVLVHSFCAKAHELDQTDDHLCCGEEIDGETDCYEHCMDAYTKVSSSHVYELSSTSIP